MLIGYSRCTISGSGISDVQSYSVPEEVNASQSFSLLSLSIHTFFLFVYFLYLHTLYLCSLCLLSPSTPFLSPYLSLSFSPPPPISRHFLLPLYLLFLLPTPSVSFCLLSFYLLCRVYTQKKISIQRAAVLQAEMAYWWKQSENNGQTGSSWQESGDDSNSTVAGRNASQNSQHLNFEEDGLQQQKRPHQEPFLWKKKRKPSLQWVTGSPRTRV